MSQHLITDHEIKKKMKTPIYNQLERQIMIQYPDELPALKLEFKLEWMKLKREIGRAFYQEFIHPWKQNT